MCPRGEMVDTKDLKSLVCFKKINWS